MQSIVFFNNKGGVGKTTLACNVAAELALVHHKRVLLVDADPQCNSTQLVLGDELFEDMYYGMGTGPTLATVLDPIAEDTSEIRTDLVFAGIHTNRFGVDIVPGSPSMAMIEDQLSGAWANAKGGTLGGIIRTNWATMFEAAYGSEYDFVIYDVGPSLGSLNRSILLAAGHIVVPMGADIFSIMGIRNIGTWISAWRQEYASGITQCLRSYSPDRLESKGISVTPSLATLLGYTVQQYVTKSKGGERRPTIAYEKLIDKIPSEISEALAWNFPPGLVIDSAHLGDVPNMYSLVPLAQAVHSPISRLASVDGLVGAQYAQQRQYSETVAAVSARMLENLAEAAA